MFRRKRTPPSQEERAQHHHQQQHQQPAAPQPHHPHAQSATNPHHFPPGALLANGRYRVRRLLNRGGSAVVYEADDVTPSAAAESTSSPSPSASSLVALKCHDLTQCDPRALDRLKREILNAKDFLQHENVVRLLNVALQHDCLVLALELVDGADLLEVINRGGGRLGEARARHYFVQLLRGVAHLHQSNLCHRDLKPENCMVCARTDTLKIIDLGLSKHLTSARTLGVGTPDYMAPELVNFMAGGQQQGADVKYDASAADVWAMGATLYLMVVGVYPFEDPQNPRDITTTLRNILSGNYRPIHVGQGVSRKCADLLQRMLVPQPQGRITLEAIWEHPWIADQKKK
mmetsp:Transcript_12145/g.31489  ORF Transcript_12145/g.31489 Transcript_12145/m.31489 type:complete len:346 (-) Transcript_12145:557-1594(-)